MNISRLITSAATPLFIPQMDEVKLSYLEESSMANPVDRFVPSAPKEESEKIRSLPEDVVHSGLSGRLSSEFAKYSNQLPSYFSRLEELNPSYSFAVVRSPEDKLSLKVKHEGKPHFMVEFNSKGDTLAFYSPDQEMAARQRLSLPRPLTETLDGMGLKRPTETFPTMAQAYSPESVMLENRRKLSGPAPDLAVCHAVARASDMFKRLESLRVEATPRQIKTLETTELRLRNHLTEMTKTDTRRNLLALQDDFDEISTMTADTDEDYKDALQSETYKEKLKQRLLTEGTVLYSHGQPFWRLRSTLLAGELSSPALRGLVPSTDCGFTNICANRHNAGGMDGGGESLSYALRGDLHPAGPLFLVKPGPLDNFAGQPATRNVVFRPGDDDGRLVRILVADKTLPQVRSWLSEAGLDPQLATGYLEYVSDT